MKYRISYVTYITDEELEEAYECDIEDYVWEHLRPEGDDWEIEEVED